MTGHYYCGAAQQNLIRYLALLGSQGIFETPVLAHEARSFVELCRPCSEGKGQTHCLGWKVNVPQDRPISLGKFVEKKRALSIRVAAKHDYSRPSPQGESEWRERSSQAANVTMGVWDVSGKEVQIARHHFDLANPKQHGSVWHLQQGGNGFGNGLETPRWATLPMDLVLTLDLIVFNYAHTRWMKLQNDGTYVSAILEAEDLVQSAWVRSVSAMLDSPRQRRVTMLRLLDNEWLPTWQPMMDPRPVPVS